MLFRYGIGRLFTTLRFNDKRVGKACIDPQLDRFNDGLLHFFFKIINGSCFATFEGGATYNYFTGTTNDANSSSYLVFRSVRVVEV